MKKINILLTCFMFASMLLSAQRMYWTDGISSIYSANLDGTDQKTILSGRIRHLSEFALDTINRKIYWIDWRLNIIGSANLDWTALEILLNLEYKPSNIIVDADNEKIYWQSNNGRQLHRANLNGKGEEVVIPAGTMVYSDLTLDGLSNTIYWFNTTTWKIQSANLDGTDVQDIVTLVPRGTYSNLAVDIANNQLFWVSRNNEGDGAMSAMRLWTRRLDRAGERVLTGIGGMFPYLNFALDVSNKQIFVSSTGDERSGFHFSVHDYTGAQKQIIPAPLAIHMPNMIFDERSFALYHIGTAGSPINKTSLKGQAPAYELKSEPVVKEKIINPQGIALDNKSQKIYWTDKWGSTIKRANTDGSNIEDLVGPPHAIAPRGIALDLEGRKMYWADQYKGIMRADLDGLNLESLNIGSRSPNDGPHGIALDIANQKLYFTTLLNGIHRANMDIKIQKVEQLNGQGLIDVIALDLENRKIYWSELIGLFGSNLDGSDKKMLMRNPTRFPVDGGIAVDGANKKVYWIIDSLMVRVDDDGKNPVNLINNIKSNRQDGGYLTFGPAQAYMPGDLVSVLALPNTLDATVIPIIFSTSLRVELPEISDSRAIHYRLYAAEGQEVKHGPLVNGQIDQLDVLPSGYYFLHISDGQRSNICKVLKTSQ